MDTIACLADTLLDRERIGVKLLEELSEEQKDYLCRYNWIFFKAALGVVGVSILMSKLLEEKLFKEYLVKYCQGKLDPLIPEVGKFLEDYAGAILMLIPEASALLVKNGLKDDPAAIFAAMAAIGATLKELGEMRLSEIAKCLYDDDGDIALTRTRKVHN